MIMAIGKKTNIERIAFDIPSEQADRLRRIEKKEPADIARDHLLGYYEDGRRTKIELVRISLGWLPEVYNALVKHVGRGWVSHYIRETLYRDMIAAGYKLAEVPVMKEGHVESASTRRSARPPEAQAGRQSAVVPLVIPLQWDQVLRKAYPNHVGQFIKSAVQMRLEAETGKELPVQRGLGEWLNR